MVGGLIAGLERGYTVNRLPPFAFFCFTTPTLHPLLTLDLALEYCQTFLTFALEIVHLMTIYLASFAFGHC